MKYQLIKQFSEEDCGAACLASIAKHYGRVFTINRIREAVGTGQLGTTLLGLRQGADILGFNARSVKASPQIFDRIHEAPLPAIIHWKGVHWVVLYGKKGNKFVVADPAVGVRYLERQLLNEGWQDGVMLLLEPDSTRFWSQEDDLENWGNWTFFKACMAISWHHWTKFTAQLFSRYTFFGFSLFNANPY